MVLCGPLCIKRRLCTFNRAIGPFYLRSVPGEVKDPTQGDGINLL